MLVNNIILILQDLYCFVLSKGVPPPFILSVSIPQKHLQLGSVGSDMIVSHGVRDTLLMIEADDCANLDEFLDSLGVTDQVIILITSCKGSQLQRKYDSP